MLRIRKEQIAVFNENFLDRLHAHLVSHVAAKYPKQFQKWGEQRTREFVTRGMDKADAHGITTEGAITVLIELMVEVGPAFENSPDRQWAHNILVHPVIPGDLKMDQIQERIRARTQGRVVTPYRREAS
jgi:hypothetical protein